MNRVRLKGRSLMVFCSFFYLSSAYAQSTSEGESKIKIEAAKETKNKVDGDIDQEITNPLLRASSGSKSRYSLSLGVNYDGASIIRPFADVRPDIYGTPANQQVSRLSTSASARYRLNKSDSLSFGTSFGLNTPFQGFNSNPQQFNVGDPTLGYNRTFAAGVFEHSLDAAVSYGSSVESRRVKQLGSVSLSHTLIKSSQSGLAIGLTSYVSGSAYEDRANFKKPSNFSTGEVNRADYGAGFLPFIEYAFNDRFRFRTVSRYLWFQHDYGDSNILRWTRMPGSQSAGIGMTFGRDIWVYPNVQWDWGTAFNGGRNTNIGIASSINLF